MAELEAKGHEGYLTVDDRVNLSSYYILLSNAVQPRIEEATRVLEAVPQAEEAQPRPALHRAERRTELVGDLGLGETLPVGELEHLAFPVGELRERGAHALRALLRRHLLRGRGWQRQGRSRRVPAPEQPQMPPARA